MEKFFLALVVAVTMTTTIAEAQSQKVSRGQSPNIVQKGNYSNSSTPTTSLTTYTSGSLPFYTKLDTIVGTNTDTFKVQLSGDYNAISFQHDYVKIAGTPTVTVAAYGSINGGVSYGSTAIATFTLSPTSTTVPLSNVNLINNGTGNPYTNYMWVSTGSASSTVTSKSCLLVR